MRYSIHNTLHEITETLRGQALAQRFMPGYAAFSNAESTSLASLCKSRPGGLDPASVQEMLRLLNAPVEKSLPEWMARPSLDDLDNASYFAPGETRTTPLDGTAIPLMLTPMQTPPIHNPRPAVNLDGQWQLAFDRDGAPDWSAPIKAPVPGSIHTALAQAGIIPDPTIGRNQEQALPYSYQDWWYRRTFPADTTTGQSRLVFGGICNRCEIFLNGESIATHEGMFGGPEIDVTGKLRPQNELIVHLFAIPQVFPGHGPMDTPDRRNTTNNDSWHDTVVSNNVYGWHYSCLPSLGIWNSVRLETVPDVALSHPFIATLDAESATMRLRVDCASVRPEWAATLRGCIRPENFEGQALDFTAQASGRGDASFLYEFQISDAKLWWPNGLGAQHLYRLSLNLAPESGLTGESAEITFGIRTVHMASLADGPQSDRYNWRFVINGKSSFIKGTGWCTLDAMMDFSDTRYDRFLKLAHIQNCQMIRAWGGGMPEKDIFYDLCDRYGIMVMQEWPTAWDSHLTQPFDMLEETVRVNTLRIRNHPSLVLYCPGNESPNPYGKAIDMMGRHASALDGTRVFHRGEPWGGSIHNYDSYWGRQPLDVHVNLKGPFFGEFGIPSVPCVESANRYLPPSEQNQWPVQAYSGFEYHTPIFGTAQDLSRLRQMVGYFADPDACTFAQMVTASQLAQILGVRHTLERARIRYPDCGGALYYKLNDNYPAMSWASVDWYGAPKLGHYVFAQSFAPLAAFVLPNRLNFHGTAHRLPVYIVDDLACGSAAYRVRVRGYKGALEGFLEETLLYEGDLSVPDLAGHIDIPYEQCTAPPIFLHIVLEKDGQEVFDTFYFFNYEADPGCLFRLPTTTLQLETGEGTATVRNTGAYPAVGVCVTRPGHADTFTAWENFFFLPPGGYKTIRVDETDGLTVSALNTEGGIL